MLEAMGMLMQHWYGCGKQTVKRSFARSCMYASDVTAVPARLVVSRRVASS